MTDKRKLSLGTFGLPAGNRACQPSVPAKRCLLYAPGNIDLEHPDFWMHQLDTDIAWRLDPGALQERIVSLLPTKG